MLVLEDGPLMVFPRFRAYLAGRQRKPGGWFDMISCIGCASVYIGSVTALALAGDVLEWILYTLSFSAVTVLTARLSDR